MDDKEKMVPRIRFRGFEDAWERLKFNSIVTKITDHSHDTQLQHIEYANIISNSGKLRNINRDYADSREGIRFKKGDILYGKLRPYLNNWWLAKFAGIAVGDFWVLRVNNSFSSLFAYALIQSESYQNIANLTTGTKMPRSDWNIVSTALFNIPTKGEQIKIGKGSQLLDDLIVANEKKGQQLKGLKKLFMEKIFSQAWRFKGFSDPWEQRKAIVN